MKKILISAVLILSAGLAAQQKTDKRTSYDFGSGFDFDFKDGYHFNIGGAVQPVYTYDKIGDAKATNQLRVNHAFFTLSGEAKKEKLGFMLQTDFSLTAPLLDAYVYYEPSEHFRTTGGQMKSPLNNREMTINEDRLSFTDRSLLSTTLSRTGREFGVFAEARIGKGNFKLVPQVAVTSGDGRNSFGANGRDADAGGIKYGGRLDLYPMGFFKDQKNLTVEDLYHEESLKMVVGGAFSYNRGASDAVGEGHGTFALYDAGKSVRYPDYRKLYIDLLMKYAGFSVLGEYGKTTARNLDGSFTDANATVMLQPQQISSYLMLGQSYNMQLGYVSKKGFGVDARYTIIEPEFGDYTGNILQKTNGYSFGLTKYFVGNALKLHLGYSNYDLGEALGHENRADLMLQVIF